MKLKRTTTTIITALAFAGLFGCSSDQEESTSTGLTPQEQTILGYVDPFIGTGPDGHTFPGAVYPSGMVQLSPDTTLEGWGSAAGYFDDGTRKDITVYGFSHTHLSGTGITDLGDILILPFIDDTNDSYNTFDKINEKAEPGYYSVKFNRSPIKAELTASARVGYHRYTFPADEKRRIRLDLEHTLNRSWGNKSLENEIELVDPYTIRGYRKSDAWSKNQVIYFYAKFSSPIVETHLFADDQEIPFTKGSVIPAKGLVSYLTFDPSSEPLEIRVGLSHTDVDGAKLNLETEVPEWGFEKVVDATQKAWAEELSAVTVTGGTEDEKTNFYTALYHTQIAPMIAQDVDGDYRTMYPYKVVENAGDTPNYTVYSMWDTFRAFHPLQTIINPDKAEDYVNDLLRKQEEGGLLPKWELYGHYTGTMIGYPAVSIIADAITKGFDIDVQRALEAAVFSSTYSLRRPKLEDWDYDEVTKGGTLGGVQNIQMRDHIEQGWVTYGWWNSASYGLEYTYGDWAVSVIAREAGDTDTENRYKKRSQYYHNYWDKDTGYFRPVCDNGTPTGEFCLAEGQLRFDPYFVDEMAFTEGNAWQWKWQIFHDFDGLDALLYATAGAEDDPEQMFKNDLRALFEAEENTSGEDLPDMTGFIGQYTHGNEPSHHIAYLWNRTDEPWMAQEYLDRIMREFYKPDPTGLVGNEDVGQMSAWYVMSAMGFYQVTPGIPEYSIGRPLFDKAVIKLPDGEFTITAVNNSPNNRYVKEVTINGETTINDTNNWTFKHENIVAGGELRFVMTSTRPDWQ